MVKCKMQRRKMSLEQKKKEAIVINTVCMQKSYWDMASMDVGLIQVEDLLPCRPILVHP